MYCLATNGEKNDGHQKT